MGQLADMAAPSLVVTIGGVEVEVAPLDVSDFGDFERWVEMMPLYNLSESLKEMDGITKEERRMLLESAYEKCNCMTVNLMDEETQGFANTVRGAHRMFYYAVHKANPEETMESVGRFVNSSTIGDLQTAIGKLTGMEDFELEGEEGNA